MDSNKKDTSKSPSHSNSSSPPSSSLSSSSSKEKKRPKRLSSQNVNYDLKKRKIITSDTAEKTFGNEHNNFSLEENIMEEEPKELLEKDSKGNIIKLNEPPTILEDSKTSITGLPLNKGPSEKIKRESLWNYRRNLAAGQSNNSEMALVPNKKIIQVPKNFQDLNKSDLQTFLTQNITEESNIRSTSGWMSDITDMNHEQEHDGDYDNKKLSNVRTKIILSSNATYDSKSKLFGQNSIKSIVNASEKIFKDENDSTINFENEDFCSACNQSGSFLCCDTCPKSFHFLCLDPPVDPNHLPEGDWHCNECKFKIFINNSLTTLKKNESNFIKQNDNVKMFAKLLFRIESLNPRQFQLPNYIKETFPAVKTGSRGQYSDENDKIPLTDRQLFNTSYGQSITKLDSYNPDIHIDSSSGEFLICYKCHQTRLGSWSHPENSRLIMTCDYCQTPWHLDCIPRASFKNLGSKWKCPLHSPTKVYKKSHRHQEVDNTNYKVWKKQRLANKKNQIYYEPLQKIGYQNSGNIQIMPSISDADYKFNQDFRITQVDENSIKYDFFDKIYKSKMVQKRKVFQFQEDLIDKLVLNAHQNGNTEDSMITDVASLIYFQISNRNDDNDNSNNKPAPKRNNLQKLWDLKELTSVVVPNELDSIQFNDISNNEIKNLLYFKKIIESKPKDELLKFLNLKNAEN
ncbi:hypothetical protein SKDZ_13G2020 [Saccharomyces kudriavzevii ZP591]|nr:hypothetical protein SKDZ_13G2020 [Saccharomyces kudriavzevii ZP591]